MKQFGPRLAQEAPEIAQDYANGLSYEQLIDKYAVIDRYAVTYEIARGIVGLALRILLTQEERQEIREKFGFTHRSRGGLTSGLNNVRLKRGIHGFSKEERSRVAIMGLLGAGKLPYIQVAVEKETGLNEKDYAIYLAGQSEYQHAEGRWPGHPHTQKIADKLNEVFHSGAPIRRARAIVYLLHESRTESNS